VGALSGIFASNLLKLKMETDLELLEDHLAVSN